MSVEKERTALLAHGQFHDDDVMEFKLPKDAVGTKVEWGTDGHTFENYAALIDKHFAFKTQEGTAGGERLDGADGADRIIGKGGADEIRALSGDDMIFVPDLNFESIDGGDGVDRLLVTGEKELSKLGDKNITDIEVLDLRGSGKNTLTLTFDDVNKLSSNIGTEALRIEGDRDDVIELDGFHNTAKQEHALSAGRMSPMISTRSGPPRFGWRTTSRYCRWRKVVQNALRAAATAAARSG
ncbi:hypothetical protein [Chelativorans salis]|uniref:Uncharacterized protein n=1 Tax=Chelativorans salis TaxID=2978478 RepID=A0ABT2LWN2_9HYPH|nr:hypothetical protein [Chelativorans sp. EGI FJ00035]MCT7377793.1 hypothetical protein [Chelativorans sp. EGI FJ00035]